MMRGSIKMAIGRGVLRLVVGEEFLIYANSLFETAHVTAVHRSSNFYSADIFYTGKEGK